MRCSLSFLFKHINNLIALNIPLIPHLVQFTVHFKHAQYMKNNSPDHYQGIISKPDTNFSKFRTIHIMAIYISFHTVNFQMALYVSDNSLDSAVISKGAQTFFKLQNDPYHFDIYFPSHTKFRMAL